MERRIASLEQAEAGVAMASGMGAITSVLWSFLQAGDELITDKTLYGCTFSFFQHGLSRFGIRVRHVDLNRLDAIESQRVAATHAMGRVVVPAFGPLRRSSGAPASPLQEARNAYICHLDPTAPDTLLLEAIR